MSPCSNAQVKLRSALLEVHTAPWCFPVKALMAALEFSPDAKQRLHFDPVLKVGPRVAAAALEENLISRAMPQGDILGFAPPLTINRGEVDEMIGRAKRAIDRVTDELVRSGDLKTGQQEAAFTV